MSIAQYSTRSDRIDSEDVGRPIEAAQKMEALIESLQSRAQELRPHAANANQIVDPELLSFLTSERGQEFAEAIRFEIFERLRQATERAQELSDELRVAERNAQSWGRVF